MRQDPTKSSMTDAKMEATLASAKSRDDDPVVAFAPGPVRLADRQNVSSFTMRYACADIATATALKSAIVRAFTAQQLLLCAGPQWQSRAACRRTTCAPDTAAAEPSSTPRSTRQSPSYRCLPRTRIPGISTRSRPIRVWLADAGMCDNSFHVESHVVSC